MSSTSTHSSRVVSMASGTMVSRLTGLFRVLVLAWVLGFTPIADSFNLANTVPNMLFDLVLGGVAGATFIPVFVERLALDGERRAWKSISSVVTGALIVLAVASVIAWFCAPWIIDGFTAFRALDDARQSISRRCTNSAPSRPTCCAGSCRRSSSTASSVSRRRCSTSVIDSASRRGSRSPTTSSASACSSGSTSSIPTPMLATLGGSPDLMWLGLGTTAGVAMQFLCLLPSLFRSDLWRLSFRFNLKDPALRAVEPARQLDVARRLAQSALTVRRAGLRLRHRRRRAGQRLHLRLVVHADALRRRGRLGARRTDAATRRHVDRRGLRGTERATALRTSTVTGHHHPVHARALGPGPTDRRDSAQSRERDTQLGRGHRARGARRGTARLHGLPTVRARTAVDAARARGLLSLRAAERPHHRVVRRHRSSLDGRTDRERLDRLQRRGRRGARRARSSPRHHRLGDLVAPRASQSRRVTRRGARHGLDILRADVEPRRRTGGTLLLRRSWPASSPTHWSSFSSSTASRASGRKMQG